MKALPWILSALLLIACVAAWNRPRKPESLIETKIKTVVRVDTLLISAPMAVFWQLTGDTIHVGDTVVQREQVVYQDSLYKAWVSGYHPRLDRLEIYPRSITHIITNDIYHPTKKRRFGIGLQAGYGYPTGAYVGIGVSYNLFMW
ncbi:DUF6808 domain-containing protein [Bacteroides heparinolyticus]|uniref:DUF6808 domain-containing protein n=2 Tax=Prevotella heparinolytica TaxID=28113 RepID=UPI0035A019DC